MKTTTRCGTTQAIEELNDALMQKALAAKILRTNKVRADSTVVEANVAYPSDLSGSTRPTGVSEPALS
jgi:IS5 family transposase